MLMVWKARQGLMVAGVRAQAQAAIGGDKAVDAFSEFRDLVNRVDIADRNERLKGRLEKLKEIKEIRFRPLVDPARRVTQLRSVRMEDLPDRGRGLRPLKVVK